MLSVENAIKIVLEHTPLLPIEEVALSESSGRVLAEDVYSDVDLPPFDRAAMDGYALRAIDTSTAPVKVSVVAQVRAGQYPERPLGPREAVGVMTGAPVPPGTTAVEPIECVHVLDAGRSVEFTRVVEPGANIARQGSEVRAGDRVLVAGARIDPAIVAVLATVGRASVRVRRRPTVAVVVTGDELVEVSERPERGRIRNANGYVIAAQVADAGAEARSLGVVPDDLDQIVDAACRGLESDVLVVSGGVSAGAFDWVEEALAKLGVDLLFTQVALKPGAPLVFGRRGETLVFGLPGNPVSAQVTFELFVRAALLRLQGACTVQRPHVDVELLRPVQNRSKRRAYLPACVRWLEGRFVAEPVPSHGSADVAAHARANALVIVEPDQLSAEAGQRAPALLVGGFLDRDGFPWRD